MFRIWRAPIGTHLLGLGRQVSRATGGSRGLFSTPDAPRPLLPRRRLMQTAAGSLEQQLAAVADLATLVQVRHPDLPGTSAGGAVSRRFQAGGRSNLHKA